MNFDPSFAPATLWFSANTFHYILKQADCGAVKYLYLLLNDIFNPAVRDQMSILKQ